MNGNSAAVIGSMAVWLLFYIFMFKIYYGDYYRSIKYNINQLSPVSDIYQKLAVLSAFPAFFWFQGKDIVHYYYSVFGVSNCISYCLIDLTHYKHGQTKIAWFQHHLILMIGLLPNYFIDIFHFQTKMGGLYEFGSIIFCLLWRADTVKNNKYLRWLCIFAYTITRIWCMIELYIYLPVLFSNYNKDMDILTLMLRILFVVMNVCNFVLNAWFAMKAIKRECTKKPKQV